MHRLQPLGFLGQTIIPLLGTNWQALLPILQHPSPTRFIEVITSRPGQIKMRNQSLIFYLYLQGRPLQYQQPQVPGLLCLKFQTRPQGLLRRRWSRWDWLLCSYWNMSPDNGLGVLEGPNLLLLFHLLLSDIHWHWKQFLLLQVRDICPIFFHQYILHQCFHIM